MRFDRLVGDVEALRLHLGLETVDLLGHSAGGGLALLYAAAHPTKVKGLILSNASFAAIGVESGLHDGVVIGERSQEPWYADALAAFHAGKAAESLEEYEQYRFAHAPLLYGPWTARAQARWRPSSSASTPDPPALCLSARSGLWCGSWPKICATTLISLAPGWTTGCATSIVNYMANNQLDGVFAALADPTRRAIVAELARRGARTTGELAEPHAMSLPAVSKHVAVLERAGLVTRRRSGRRHVCTLHGHALSEAARWLDENHRFWTERLDRLAAYLEDQP